MSGCLYLYTFRDISIRTHNISISSISNYLQVSSLKVTCLSIKKVQLQQLHSHIPFRHGFENAGCLRRYFYHLSGMKMDPWDNRPGGQESWFGKSRLPEGYGPWNQRSMCPCVDFFTRKRWLFMQLDGMLGSWSLRHIRHIIAVHPTMILLIFTTAKKMVDYS